MGEISYFVQRLAECLPDERQRPGFIRDVLTRFAEAAKDEVTARPRATGEPRPKWENDALPDEDPAHFVARAYPVEMEAGTLHRGVIGKEDPAGILCAGGFLVPQGQAV